MKPSRSSPRQHPLTAQLALPLQASRIAALDTTDRAGVVALLARLLFEAVQSPRAQEDAHDAS
jgi:hypothetical protein